MGAFCFAGSLRDYRGVTRWYRNRLYYRKIISEAGEACTAGPIPIGCLDADLAVLVTGADGVHHDIDRSYGQTRYRWTHPSAK